MSPAPHLSLGEQGESLARAALEREGYEILATRYRFQRGEIDIIARDGTCLVFVEVKTRRNHERGTPAEAVTRGKQRQLIRLASAYLALVRPVAEACRFDVVAVTVWEDRPPEVVIIRDAFDAS
ncbi:MAG TPA: YraN family protein [Vicinamibacterales bacterium]